MRRDREHQPIQAKALALSLAARAWKTISWREGTADWLVSRYARMRVRAAHRDEKLPKPRAEVLGDKQDEVRQAKLARSSR